MDVIQYAFGLLIVITLVIVYIPIMFIRKMDSIKDSLQRIEANTRKQ
jgi:hypothetical protein